MTTAAQRKQHLQWLCELTAIPTAAGKEDRVIAWVRAWAKKRTNLKLSADKAGNLILKPRAKPSKSGVRPVYITASRRGDRRRQPRRDQAVARDLLHDDRLE